LQKCFQNYACRVFSGLAVAVRPKKNPLDVVRTFVGMVFGINNVFVFLVNFSVENENSGDEAQQSN
jgi:hypothetical protein